MEAKRVGFFQAFKLFFTHYVDFEGKSTRAAYWWWQLWEFLFGIILGVVLVFSLVLPLSMHGDGEITGAAASRIFAGIIIPILIAVLWGLGTLVPRISLLVRRFRDAGVNPLLVLITLGVPYLIGQFLSMQMLINVPAALESGNGVSAAITQHPLLFGIGYGLVIVLEILNFVVTLLPSSKKRRFM
jgi:uncharacterized membrane protein YhaH (DUF805 family)